MRLGEMNYGAWGAQTLLSAELGLSVTPVGCVVGEGSELSRRVLQATSRSPVLLALGQRLARSSWEMQGARAILFPVRPGHGSPVERAAAFLPDPLSTPAVTSTQHICSVALCTGLPLPLNCLLLSHEEVGLSLGSPVPS